MPIAALCERINVEPWPGPSVAELPEFLGVEHEARVMINSVNSSAKGDNRRRQIVVKIPGVCGGRATISGTRMPVWGLEVARRAGCSDQRILEMYPAVKKTELLAAWKWVRSHKAEIEHDIAENEEA